MKSAIIALCIFACAYATDFDAKVVKETYELAPSGEFQYAYETDNGIKGDASGKLKPIGKDEVALEITGSNSFKAPDGIVYDVSFVADENGFRPVGVHLPTPPEPEPIPEYIARAIQYIKDHPYEEKKP